MLPAADESQKSESSPTSRTHHIIGGGAVFFLAVSFFTILHFNLFSEILNPQLEAAVLGAVSCPTGKVCDVNNDKKVDITDIYSLAKVVSVYTASDYNNDGKVDSTELSRYAKETNTTNPIAILVLANMVGSYKSYDYNNDGKLDSNDITTFTQLIQPTIASGPVIPISSCQTISKPGNYVLTKDISTSSPATAYSATCINIQNTQNVSLDCNNHAINANPSIWISNASDLGISNCSLQQIGAADPKVNIFYGPLVVSSTTRAVIRNNTIGGEKSLFERTSYITISGNTFSNLYSQSHSKYNVIQNNKLTIPNIPPANPNNFVWQSAIQLGQGSNNIVMSNSMQGFYTPVAGSDDGITLEFETNDIVINNFITDFSDCGIEHVGYMFNHQILNNTIQNTRYCGIGGWWGSSVKDNVISNNKVSSSTHMFAYFRAGGLSSGDPPVYFKDNTFSLNIFTHQVKLDPYSSSFVITPCCSTDALPNGVRPVTIKDIVTGGNLFKDNDFGNVSAPMFGPSAMIVDGGGNKCLASDTTGKSDGPYPIVCNPIGQAVPRSSAKSPTPFIVNFVKNLPTYLKSLPKLDEPK